MNKKRALVVDDDPDATYLVARVLSLTDFDADELNSPLDTLDRLRTTLYDLLLLDIMMPEKNGLLLAEEIRKVESLHLLPIVIISAKSLDSEERIRIRQMGCQFLPKPVMQRELLQTLMRLFE